MPPRYKVVTHERADADLQNAYENILYAHADYFAARKWRDGLLEELKRLAWGYNDHPYMTAPTWRALKYRRVKYKRHIIVYRVVPEERLVVVVGIMLARRDFTKIAPPEG